MGEIHTSVIAKRFLNQLNLDSGKNLFVKCKKFWPHYGEVVKNRKSCILDLVKNAITEKKIEQVIIFGAGYDALSLEISSWSKNCGIFEIDIANMDTKKNLIDSLDLSLSNSIRCITLDMFKLDRIVSTLIKHGWNKDIPSIVIFEGISYYLSRDILWKIIEKFNTATHYNRILLEYLVPNKKISKQRIPIAEYPFHLIAIESDLINITKYNLEEIMAHLNKHDGILLQHCDMKKMEKNRTLQNIIFKTKQDGWIEICEFLI